MKKTLCIYIVMILLSVGVFASFTQVASAVPPVCFTLHRDNAADTDPRIEVWPCSNDYIVTYVSSSVGAPAPGTFTTAQNDTCYLVETTTGQPSKSGSAPIRPGTPEGFTCAILAMAASPGGLTAPGADDENGSGDSQGGGGLGSLEPTLNADQEPEGGEGKVCGDIDDEKRNIKISINIGCRGEGNPIVDMVFAFTRFLSVGIGVVIVGSVIVGGIQYTTAGGDPQKTKLAVSRLTNNAAALMLYVFIFALLNWLVPGGVF